MSHVYVVAEPVDGDTELATDLLDASQSANLIALLQRVPTQIPNASHIHPPWNYLTSHEPRADGLGVHRQLPGRRWAASTCSSRTVASAEATTAAAAAKMPVGSRTSGGVEHC